jgi:hypothetical protein
MSEAGVQVRSSEGSIVVKGNPFEGITIGNESCLFEEFPTNFGILRPLQTQHTGQTSEDGFFMYVVGRIVRCTNYNRKSRSRLDPRANGYGFFGRGEPARWPCVSVGVLVLNDVLMRERIFFTMSFIKIRIENQGTVT